MDWVAFWKQFVLVLVAIPALAGFVWYVGKTIVDRWFSARADAYKHELEIISKRDEIQFANLHGKRADHIEKLYSLLKEFFYAATEYIPGLRSNSEKLKKMNSATNALVPYFDIAQIYFSKSQAELIQKYIKEIRDLVMEKLIDADLADAPDARTEVTERIMMRWNKLQEETPKIFEGIEMEFRKLLGVEK